MVTGYTATEYGDYLIASLQEPYYNTIKVLDWEIIAGVQNSTTIGTVSTTAGSTTLLGTGTDFTVFSAGDEIILGNTIFEIASISAQNVLELTIAPTFTTTNLEYYLPVNDNNKFEYEYRWSHTNSEFSEFRELNEGIAIGDIKSLMFDPSKPLWIDIKAEVASLSAGHSISIISVTFTLETDSGVIESCPQFCVECTDPFAMDGCANIKVSCDTDTFNPYQLTKSATIYKQLVGITNNIFGHEVTYFRTESDARTEDVILMEYSLHNVVEKDTVKILVPDNEFPDEANTYDIFGMEFAEFEIHIVAEEFERVFGLNKKPRNKDYMYIPIINKMYEIESMSLADEFNRDHSYWRVKLVKYQDRTSVIKGEFEDDTDALVTGVEEIFGERQAEEMEKDTNPQQFQTVSTLYRDGIRQFADRSLSIIDYDLKNRWTVISKNYYDLKNITTNNTAILYTVPSKLSLTENLGISLWFSPQFNNADTTEYVLFGDIAAIGGFKIYISNTKLKVVAGSIEHEFNHGLTFSNSSWYGLILNISNTFLQLSASIYRLDSTNNSGMIPGQRPQDASNNLIQEYTNIIEMPQELIWNPNENYHLRGNNTYMTNIRVFEKTIELEQHHNILNQYVVRDNQLSNLIDNAIPSLGYQKFYNAR